MIVSFICLFHLKIITRKIGHLKQINNDNKMYPIPMSCSLLSFGYCFLEMYLSNIFFFRGKQPGLFLFVTCKSYRNMFHSGKQLIFSPKYSIQYSIMQAPATDTCSCRLVLIYFRANYTILQRFKGPKVDELWRILKTIFK